MRDILRVGEVEYGWLSAAQSVGAAIAALVVSQLPELRKQGQLFLGSVVVFGAATIVFGVSTSLVLAWFALTVIGAADSVSTIIRNTIRQLQTPDHIRGRMTSVNQIFFQGGPQLGEVEVGAAAQLFGAPLAIITGGIGCIIGMGLIIRKWPLLLTYNGDEHLPAAYRQIKPSLGTLRFLYDSHNSTFLGVDLHFDPAYTETIEVHDPMRADTYMEVKITKQ